MFVFNTGLVVAEAVDGKAALCQSESFGCYRAVWEEDEHDDTPAGTERANHDEFVLPGREGDYNMTYTVSK